MCLLVIHLKLVNISLRNVAPRVNFFWVPSNLSSSIVYLYKNWHTGQSCVDHMQWVVFENRLLGSVVVFSIIFPHLKVSPLAEAQTECSPSDKLMKNFPL